LLAQATKKRPLVVSATGTFGFTLRHRYSFEADTFSFYDGGVVEVDAVLAATGRRPNVTGLGLEAAGVQVNEHGAIAVDDDFRTSVPHICAIGDVIDRVARRMKTSGELIMRANQLSGTQWSLLCERWCAISAAQRQYILNHPGCIPDRDERVRWLSRLGYARPRLLAEAEQLRMQAALP
jgi:hypothetical protein